MTMSFARVIDKKERAILKGEIWIADLGEVNGRSSIQKGKRPGIIWANYKCLMHSPVIHFIPITGKVKKPLSTHVDIPTTCGLNRDSIAMAEQEMLIDKTQLLSFIGKCDTGIMERLTVAKLIQAGDNKNITQIVREIKIEDEVLEAKDIMLKAGISRNTINAKITQRDNLVKELKILCSQFNINFQSFLIENNISTKPYLRVI